MVLTMFSLILLRVIEEAHITCEFDVISVMLSTFLCLYYTPSTEYVYFLFPLEYCMNDHAYWFVNRDIVYVVLLIEFVFHALASINRVAGTYISSGSKSIFVGYLVSKLLSLCLPV